MVGPIPADQIDEQAAINPTVVDRRGWMAYKMLLSCESDMREQLLEHAIRLGTPTATRSGGSLCDALLPTMATAANSKSLSKIYSVGEFPLHSDTAHWVTPCRYVILACLSPGRGGRSTALLDTRNLPLDESQISLLESTPLRVTNGRNSFFSLIQTKSRPFVRFDPGCMSATNSNGAKALSIFSRQSWPDSLSFVHWEAGLVVVLDNWRILHGRGYAGCLDPERKILRISIR